MALDGFTRELYRKVIEYETGTPLDESLTEYTFQGNYYFAVGDNAMSSFDSRYWGFIPEDFIIGIVGGKRFR
jgi:signal peptidase I